MHEAFATAGLVLAVAGVATLLAASPASAQAAKPVPAAKAEARSDLPGGASSLEESYDDWQVACAQPGGQKRCAISQTLINQDNKQRVLALELTPAAGDAAEGVLVMPYGLALDAGAKLQIDEAAPGKALAYKTCLPAGCIVPLTLDAATVSNLRKGQTLKVNAVAADNGQPIVFSVSLKGFGPALARTAALMK